MSESTTKCDVLIIGGGAAGLFCAIEAGKRRKRVIVLEKNPTPGRKIIISGGGRCNFTNITVTANNFVSRNPHFVKSALAGYSSQDFISLVQEYGIEYYEKTLGQLFCRNRSQEILDLLLKECRKAGVEIRTSIEIESVDADFKTKTNEGVFAPSKLVVACGGKSFPKVGATGFGYKIATDFGLKLVDIRPSLVPLRFKSEDFSKLSGVSIFARGMSEGSVFEENLLFTHRGLSGPLVLQISNYWKPDIPVEIDLAPKHQVNEVLDRSRSSSQTLEQVLCAILPKRFVEMFFAQELLSKRTTEISKAQMESIAATINGWRVIFDETEGYDKAEVTFGGVDTNELNSSTMESKKIPGLYFIGEVVDVTGWLGGYNFQWAWSSGYACGNSV